MIADDFVPTMVFTVSDMNELVREALSMATPEALWVEGEVSQSRTWNTHIFFTLKDETSCINAVIWSSSRSLVGALPREGSHVRCRCRFNVNVKKGDYSLVVDRCETIGQGDLYRKFVELQRRLSEEGLFDADRKRPIPAFCRNIAVVTSADGAVLHDILEVSGARAPWTQICLVPSRVQGMQAAGDLVAALERAGRLSKCDVIILARGGGSMEDLWCFNSELLARAIVSCPIPVVTAIGHESDSTIADFASDRRASTPTDAAVICTSDGPALEMALSEARQRLQCGLQAAVRSRHASLREIASRPCIADPAKDIRRRLEAVSAAGKMLERCAPSARLRERRALLGAAVERLRAQVSGRLAAKGAKSAAACGSLRAVSPARRLAGFHERAAMASVRVAAAGVEMVRRRSAALESAEHALRLLGPQNVLQRGYALVFDSAGRVLLDASGLRRGDALRIQLAADVVEAHVETIRSTDADRA